MMIAKERSNWKPTQTNHEVNEMLNELRPVTVAAAAIAFALTIGCGGKDDQSKSSNTSPKSINVSSMVLFKKYKTDKAGADKTYKGKKLRVTGLVEKKGEWLGKPYLALIGSGKKGAMFGYVRCYAPKDKVAAINIGRVVTVKGTCGKRVDVELRNCRIIK